MNKKRNPFRSFFTYFLLPGLMLVSLLMPFPLTADTISQSILFEYQVSEKNRYYLDGKRLNEYDDTASNNYSTYGQNYVIKSRTGYHQQYFAILLDYTYSTHQVNYFNQLGSKIDSATQERTLHSIQPYVFGIYDPFRIGLSYYYKSDNSTLTGEQIWSLLPGNSLSFYFQIYFSELWDNGPIGLSGRYQISIQPEMSTAEIEANLYHHASFGFHINFNYYGQFEILFGYILHEKDYYFVRMASDTENNTYFRKNLKRYYTDFIYTFQILEFTSLNFGVGQLVYSEYESPMFRFLFGVTYQFDY